MALRYKTNFITLKPVLVFQTLTLATLGKWGTTHESVFLGGQELLLDFAAWFDLTLNADFIGSCVQSYRTHFASLKRVDDLRVYEGFMMPLNYQAAAIQGTLKQC